MASIDALIADGFKSVVATDLDRPDQPTASVVAQQERAEGGGGLLGYDAVAE
jgi:hypothetical protein